MSAATLDLGTVYRGDTWGGLDGLPFLVVDAITVCQEYLASPIDRVRMHLRSTTGTSPTPALSLDTATEGGDSRIAITDAAAWAFSVGPVPAADMQLPAGTYRYDIEITDTAGLVLTVLAGQLVVEQDVSYG